MICFTIQKITNARITKLMTIVMKLPYASSGTPALVSASYVIGPPYPAGGLPSRR